MLEPASTGVVGLCDLGWTSLEVKPQFDHIAFR